MAASRRISISSSPLVVMGRRERSSFEEGERSQLPAYISSVALHKGSFSTW